MTTTTGLAYTKGALDEWHTFSSLRRIPGIAAVGIPCSRAINAEVSGSAIEALDALQELALAGGLSKQSSAIADEIIIRGTDTEMRQQLEALPHAEIVRPGYYRLTIQQGELTLGGLP